MTNSCVLGNDLPFPATGFQDALDFYVERLVHSPILVKYSSNVKEHFTRRLGHSRLMSEKSINQVVAENLAYWMGQAEMTQMTLAEKAGVSQKTISNYLNPEQRTEGSTGKHPSAKLTELDRVAKALQIQVWQLTREMSARERQMYEAIEKAYLELRATASEVKPSNPPMRPRRAKGWIDDVQRDENESDDVRRVQDQDDAGSALGSSGSGQKRRGRRASGVG